MEKLGNSLSPSIRLGHPGHEEHSDQGAFSAQQGSRSLRSPSFSFGVPHLLSTEIGRERSFGNTLHLQRTQRPQSPRHEQEFLSGPTSSPGASSGQKRSRHQPKPSPLDLIPPLSDRESLHLPSSNRPHFKLNRQNILIHHRGSARSSKYEYLSTKETNKAPLSPEYVLQLSKQRAQESQERGQERGRDHEQQRYLRKSSLEPSSRGQPQSSSGAGSTPERRRSKSI